MSTQPSGEAGDTVFKSCTSCRLVSGGGISLCGLYVFRAGIRMRQYSAPSSIGAVIQMTFGLGLTALGIVVVTDISGKDQWKKWRVPRTAPIHVNELVTTRCSWWVIKPKTMGTDLCWTKDPATFALYQEWFDPKYSNRACVQAPVSFVP